MMIIFSTGHLIAQSGTPGKYSFLKFNALRSERSIDLGKKENKQTDFQTSLMKYFFNETFQPKLSVDLLDGSGIHLFTISDIDFIPTIKVGARIKAGFTITI